MLPTARDAGPADRVPRGGLSRDARDALTEPEGANDRTREPPQLDADGKPKRRPTGPRETPLDDLPTLADELLGSYDDEGEDGGRRRRR